MKLHHLLHAPERRWMLLLFAFTITGLGLFAANSTPASAAATWTVTTLADRNNASCVAGDCSLREAIKSANAGAGGDAINFASGLNGTLLLTIGALPNIAKSVTIDGGGAIAISGANNFRIFYVPTGLTLTLNNIILENGNSGSDYGGAICVVNGTLVLNNSTVQNSQTNHYEGGAIFNSGGAVTLNNSLVQGNTGYDNGAISSSGILTLTNSIVRNNTAAAGGGGLSVIGRVTISSSQIYSNTATSEYGGALRILSGGQVTINNSQIYSNHADNTVGGGIYNKGTLTVTQSTLSGNSGYGGGIFNDSGTATLTNVTLSGNSAGGEP